MSDNKPENVREILRDLCGTYDSIVTDDDIAEALQQLKELMPTRKEIFDMCFDIILKNADKDSRIWFDETSEELSLSIRKLIEERLGE